MNTTITTVFDKKSSPHFSDNSEFNQVFLEVQRNYFNDRLKVYGFVFLNEILQVLGLKRTSVGQIVGWAEGGIGYVDFQISKDDEDAYTLVFHVDGPILHKIDQFEG